MVGSWIAILGPPVTFWGAQTSGVYVLKIPVDLLVKRKKVHQKMTIEMCLQINFDSIIKFIATKWQSHIPQKGRWNLQNGFQPIFRQATGYVPRWPQNHL